MVGGWKNWPTVFDVAKLQEKSEGLKLEQAQPDFWNDQERAQSVSKEIAELDEELQFIGDTAKKLEDLAELFDLAEAEHDVKTEQDITHDLELIEASLVQREQDLRFDGPYDRHAAIISIQAGAGGTDAQDWAQMLERMYLRAAEHRSWHTILYDRSAGEEAGIKSTTFEIRGRFAYGILKQEHGVHRLVRQSPFNSDNLRQTSFARVEVTPKLPPAEVPEIDVEDLEIDTFRASGAGGQHVNKTSSAIRIRHIPTGIVVQSQAQRSQAQNKAQAMAHLQAKLQLLAQQEHVAQIKELKGDYREAAWGNQIRSYVLHPYKLVKDHRTNIEEKNIEAVLDGNLDAFWPSYCRKEKRGNSKLSV